MRTHQLYPALVALLLLIAACATVAPTPYLQKWETKKSTQDCRTFACKN